MIHKRKKIKGKSLLYDPPPRILEIKAKINKWDLINLKSFYSFFLKLGIPKIKTTVFFQNKGQTRQEIS